MKEKRNNQTEEQYTDDWEPSWVNPKNDRKTPYTEDEIEEFAEGFINSMSDTAALQSLIEQVGMRRAREIVKESFRRKDELNLANMDIHTPEQ